MRIFILSLSLLVAGQSFAPVQDFLNNKMVAACATVAACSAAALFWYKRSVRLQEQEEKKAAEEAATVADLADKKAVELQKVRDGLLAEQLARQLEGDPAALRSAWQTFEDGDGEEDESAGREAGGGAHLKEGNLESKWYELLQAHNANAVWIEGKLFGWPIENKLGLYDIALDAGQHPSMLVSMFAPRQETLLRAEETPDKSIYGNSQYCVGGETACTSIALRIGQALFDGEIENTDQLNELIYSGIQMYNSLSSEFKDAKGFVVVDKAKTSLPVSLVDSRFISQIGAGGGVQTMEEFLRSISADVIGILFSQGTETFLIFKRRDTWYLFDSHRKRKDQLQESGSGLHRFSGIEKLIKYLEDYVPSTQDTHREKEFFEANVFSKR